MRYIIAIGLILSFVFVAGCCCFTASNTNSVNSTPHVDQIVGTWGKSNAILYYDFYENYSFDNRWNNEIKNIGTWNKTGDNTYALIWDQSDPTDATYVHIDGETMIFDNDNSMIFKQ